MTRTPAMMVVLAVLLLACGSSSDARDDGGGGGDGSATCSPPPALDYDEGGCLTVESAARFCGSESSQQICEFAVRCGFATSVEECNAECVNNVPTHCYGDSNVECTVSELCRDDCASFRDCGIVL